ncbi:amino acid adenylation domain-containing protein [candidate division KSB1 bacterium]|nr:amino acid adenylation domain-containing protein [candidate division KSB1 bacterium]
MTKNAHTKEPATLRVSEPAQQAAALQPHLHYWKMQLEDRLPVLDLPADHTRSAAQEYRRQTHAQKLTSIQLAALQSFARERETDEFTVLLAAFQALLWRYTGQDDLLVAALFSLAASNGASPAKCSDGAANVVILRAAVNGSAPFHTLLAECHRAAEEAYAHRQVRLEQLVEALFPHRDLSRAPLFQVMFAFYENENAAPNFADKPDCALAVLKKSRELECQFIYNAELFDAATLARMAGHYEALLGGILASPNEAVSNLPMMTAEEYQQVVVEWNGTHVPFPDNACLHELFEAQVYAAPEAVAVVFNDEHLTYGELNRRANQLAHHLHGLGLGPDALVGVCMERSLEMVIGLYGILKAGGAYVPMDPSYPPSRLAFMLEDTQVPVLLTTRATMVNYQLSSVDCQLICLDTDWQTIARARDDQTANDATADHLAYVIYTSGSTGQPKGAVLNHRGRVNNFCDFNRRYEVKPGDRLLGISSLSFDMSAYDTFGTLAAGGTLVLVETAAILEPSRWAELMVDQQITVWHSVPALLEMLVDFCEYRKELHPRALRLALLGGDWIPVSLPDRLKAQVTSVHVVSMGGATEVSMDSTIYDIDEPSSGWKSIPYGVPMYNQLAYVLDAELQPLPIGIPGELHLGGIGVGRGYWNRPELTAQKFIPNPFSGVPGDRMYKTGDLARYRPNSNLELLGRIDFQVKIRGFRIELGEITSALTKHPAVKEAVVVAKDEKSGQVGAGKRLVAYVVPEAKYRSQQSQSARQLVPEWREYLQKCLPEYMVPTAFVLLEALPLSPNGKIDRPALSRYDGNHSRPELSTPFVAPRHPVEEVVAQIWAGVFELEPIGVLDNFFELGGHSLMATKILAQLRDIFPVSLTMSDFWEAPAVGQFAERLSAAGRAGQIDVVEIARTLLQVNQLSDEQIAALLAEKATLG